MCKAGSTFYKNKYYIQHFYLAHFNISTEESTFRVFLSSSISWRAELVTPRFSSGFINPNDRVKPVTLVKRRSTWPSPRKHHQQPLMTHFGQPWSTMDNLGQNPLKPLWPSLLPRTFAVFSKLHLNTSNSPNIKVMQFGEGHNFHVEWHLRLEV
jgi:hypothetical protein